MEKHWTIRKKELYNLGECQKQSVEPKLIYTAEFILYDFIFEMNAFIDKKK